MPSPGPGLDPLQRLDAALAVAIRRLRLRGAVRGAAIGAWGGAAAAVGIGLLRQVGVLDDRPAAIAAVLALLTALGIGAAIGAIRRTLGPREAALLLDRKLGTEELLVTAAWLRTTPPEPVRNAVIAQLDTIDPRGAASAIPVRPPRHSRWLPIPLAAALIALLAPAWRPALALRAAGSDDPVVQEGSRLAERLDKIAQDEAIELPDGIEREVAALAKQMQGETLTPEEARKRLEELQQHLDAFEQAMAQQRDALKDLENAAKALDQAPTRDLAQALRDANMDAAADAAQKLADKLGTATPFEKQQAAQALAKAGSELARSSDPSLQQAGQAMQQAAQAAAGQQGQQPGQQGQQGQQGPQGQQGQQGQQAGQQGQPGQSGSGGLSPADAQQLAQAIQQARQAGQQLQQDKAALERSQELNGALEGSRQRLGGEASMDDGSASDGEGQGQGQGQDGEGEGQGDGNGNGTGDGSGNGASEDGSDGQGQNGMAGPGVGAGHTWEDEGEFTNNGAPDRGQRYGDRDHGLVVNDFERLYKSIRNADAESLLTSAPGQMNEDGQVDLVPMRLTGSDETASTATMQLPDGYREAAADAMSSEQIPPGYRDAVKQYFDELE